MLGNVLSTAETATCVSAIATVEGSCAATLRLSKHGPGHPVGRRSKSHATNIGRGQLLSNDSCSRMRRWRRGAFVRVKTTMANVAFATPFSCGATIFVTHSPKHVFQHDDGGGGACESIASPDQVCYRTATHAASAASASAMGCRCGRPATPPHVPFHSSYLRAPSRPPPRRTGANVLAACLCNTIGDATAHAFLPRKPQTHARACRTTKRTRRRF